MKRPHIRRSYRIKLWWRALFSRTIALDYSKIDMVEVDGIDTRDYPEFTDAFIGYAEYDGVEMTDEQYDVLNEDYDYVHEKVFETFC